MSPFSLTNTALVLSLLLKLFPVIVNYFFITGELELKDKEVTVEPIFALYLNGIVSVSPLNEISYTFEVQLVIGGIINSIFRLVKEI